MPVKTTNELLTLWSDAYELNEQYQIVLKRGVEKAPVIELEEKYYGKIEDLQKRFSKGIPSLSECKELKIYGDVSFGEDVICEGKVTLKASSPVFVQNCLLSGEVNLDSTINKSKDRTGG